MSAGAEKQQAEVVAPGESSREGKDWVWCKRGCNKRVYLRHFPSGECGSSICLAILMMKSREKARAENAD